MDMLTDPRTPLRKPISPIETIARPRGCDGVGLVLQGGGALMTELGAYIRHGRALPLALDAFIGKLRAELALRESQEAKP